MTPWVALSLLVLYQLRPLSFPVTALLGLSTGFWRTLLFLHAPSVTSQVSPPQCHLPGVTSPVTVLGRELSVAELTGIWGPAWVWVPPSLCLRLGTFVGFFRSTEPPYSRCRMGSGGPPPRPF